MRNIEISSKIWVRIGRYVLTKRTRRQPFRLKKIDRRIFHLTMLYDPGLSTETQKTVRS